MQIQPTTSSPLAAIAAQQSANVARLIGGDVGGLPVGALLSAVVSNVLNGATTLDVAGKQLTVRTALSLNIGDAVTVALSPNGQLEVTRPTPIAASQTIRTTPVAVDSPIATVGDILRQDKPPPLGESLPNLRTEIADQPRAAKVRTVLDSILPDTPRPTDAGQLESLVKDGGQFLEAKLERRAAGERINFGQDLKAVLTELVAAAPQLVAARTTLDGIEYQQAANVLAQQSTGAFVVPVPFPDGTNWRTLHLAIEPDASGGESASERTDRFRLLMHVPLTELGETYIDASVDGDHLRAVLYLDSTTAREQVRPELAGLETELRASGFRDVLLDVRPASDLPDRRRQQANAMAAGRADTTSVVDVRV
ncbi:flagellar hook-length control protein FliK [Limnoglobus roseus]|uniref:Flagellar hook-length control protein FliK n=1 Tax=Limnoglobus roseus TaxID=2598579 RepID=A0A5C1A4S3_9BACT|nr:flagellar hook-length control protein FliK [Limnoglobus roseus]QEL13333.1 flagellar hook-length control protein FliK [Limnoglobus roseus]